MNCLYRVNFGKLPQTPAPEIYRPPLEESAFAAIKRGKATVPWSPEASVSTDATKPGEHLSAYNLLFRWWSPGAAHLSGTDKQALLAQL